MGQLTDAVPRGVFWTRIMFDVDSITDQVLLNCRICDARYAGLYSICGLALRLRDLYKWEMGLDPWIEKESSEILDWIGAKEEIWECLYEAEFNEITVLDRRYDPFDALEINTGSGPGQALIRAHPERLKPLDSGFHRNDDPRSSQHFWMDTREDFEISHRDLGGTEDLTNLIEKERKSRVLTRSQFGCLRDAFTLNVTRGCEFSCVYCYARGYPEAPLKGEVHLYRNLPERLASEIDSPRRRSAIDSIIFNTASDSFQTHPKILDITYRTMQVLLERGISLSFLTKGWIPKRFISLFSAYPGLVLARIGLVSTSLGYRDLFEPCAAAPEERLENIERLKGAGIEVEVRIDPIIPFYTDDEDSITRLYAALSARGIRKVALNYLHLRPAILEQLRGELPPTEWNLLRGCFETRAWTVLGTSSKSKLIPVPLRERGYGRFIRMAKEFGIVPVICGCKNPEFPGVRCSAGMRPSPCRKPETGQLSLFSC